MKKVSWLSAFAWLLTLLLAVWFFVAVTNVSRHQTANGKQQLEDALRRATVACYAAEGVYPPSLAYLQEHYGTQIDTARYTVFYEYHAENLMPEITVLEKT